MTKEEAMSRVEGYLTDLFPSEEFDEVEEIMRALEQEPILDKIKAKIEEAQMYQGIYGVYIDKDYVLEIIDKYKSRNGGMRSERRRNRKDKQRL